MLLSGRLSDWSVEDLLQMLHITKKTASLHVDGVERSGVVYFDEGAIAGAEVTVGAGEATGREAAVEAIYVLLLLDEGEFEMRNEVSPSSIEPLGVADALELASEHVAAERSLDDTGLLAARGLRLAQEIDEPIILSEQVWAAISVSIPAFTFAELERRMGRAGAVDTLEQFRDLGILEAVLDDPGPEPADRPVEVSADPEPDVSHDFESDVTGATPEVVPVDDVEIEEIEVFDTDPAPLTPFDVDGEDDEIVPVAEDDTWIEPRHDVAPMWMADEDETEAPVTEPEEDAPAAPQAGGSLSDAIRAAAAAAAPGSTTRVPAPTVDVSGDDESTLLSEAAADQDALDEVVEGDATERPAGSGLRRSVEALVSQSDTTLVQGVLDDLGTRFRQQSGD